MSASVAARVLDLNEFRRRREERERPAPPAPRAIYPFATTWVPVVYWVPVWAPVA